MKKENGAIIFSPTDLIRFFGSPFASWMDHYYLENRDVVAPDAETEDQRLIAQTGDEHEQRAFQELSSSTPGLVAIPKKNFREAHAATLAALSAKAPVIFQAALADGSFGGYADFLILDPQGRYQVWDTKLARSPKPYYAVQLCCYAEMLAAVLGGESSDKFGIILGSKDRVEFRIEDFTHYYRGVRLRFLEMHEPFSGRLEDCPEPLPRADHGCWTSRADQFFADTDNLVQVANISVSQIKKLKGAGIATVAGLAGASGNTVRKLSANSLEKLAAQARLQCRTREARQKDPDAAHVSRPYSTSARTANYWGWPHFQRKIRQMFFSIWRATP
jgi:uncharacterized protein